MAKHQPPPGPEPTQLSLGLPTTEPARSGRAVNNLFFALVPDPDTAVKITAFAAMSRARYGLTGSVRPANVLHISLNNVGRYVDLSDASLSDIRRAGDRVRAAPFEVKLDRLVSFKNSEKRPLVLLVDDGARSFAALGRALQSALASVGVRAYAAPSTPHLTFLYDWNLVPETALDKPILFRAHEFVLVQSLVGQTRHIIHGRWPLRT